LKALSVANCYIFNCKTVAKVENGGRRPDFLAELGSFLVVYKKIGKFWHSTLNFSALWVLKLKGVTVFGFL